uniref:Uncharacterized protein n=1 Tax=Glossina palpalis gambiensis TaxID=67801 RepID=A0A1B0BU97_9MUSC
MEAFVKSERVSSSFHSLQNPVFNAQHTLIDRFVIEILDNIFSKLWQPEQRQTSNIFNGALCKNLREMTKKVLVQEEFCSSVCDQIHIKTPEYYMVRLVVLETHHDQMRQIITVDLSLHGYEPKLLDIASNLYR